tara:strand:+ start:649 stop:1371 length:723 start_codon:yes stop_codon:yes gene_type:complete
MSAHPSFPPLLSGLATGPANPFAVACAEAVRGTDSGLLTWSLSEDRLRAALVLAPEEPLCAAMAAFCACAVGLQNALGVLAAPETAVQLDWSGGLRVNQAHCGGLRVAASTRDPLVEPDWLVIGMELTLSLPDALEPGQTPEWTALNQEGCGEIDPLHLLEAWARHSLLWINGLDDAQGRANLYREWKGLVFNLGKEITLPIEGQRLAGTFLGVDENFSMVLKTEAQTRLIPLTQLLEEV